MIRKNFSSIILSVIFISTIFLSYSIFNSEKKIRLQKAELIELCDIKYGLFNIDAWKEKISTILVKEINDFTLSGKNKEDFKLKVSSFLFKTIDNLEKTTLQENNSSYTGFFRNAIIDFTGIFQQLKKNIPIFSEEVINFINDSENTDGLKSALKSKIQESFGNISTTIDYSYRDAIIKKYGLTSSQETIVFLEDQLSHLNRINEWNKRILFVLSILTFGFLFIVRKKDKFHYAIILGIISIFLFIGIMLPMIEIDIRISELSFSFFGEKVQFNNQVLYYKSKSIMDVVRLMLMQNKIDVMLIGFLIFLFSIVTPFFKIISSVIVLIKPALKANRLINFSLIKSGKWSMADVMVVAIFMAYIGFTGIISDQLENLTRLNDGFSVITTDKSALKIGFISFTLFVLNSIVVASQLNKLNIEENSPET